MLVPRFFGTDIILYMYFIDIRNLLTAAICVELSKPQISYAFWPVLIILYIKDIGRCKSRQNPFQFSLSDRTLNNNLLRIEFSSTFEVSFEISCTFERNVIFELGIVQTTEKRLLLRFIAMLYDNCLSEYVFSFSARQW